MLSWVGVTGETDRDLLVSMILRDVRIPSDLSHHSRVTQQRSHGHMSREHGVHFDYTPVCVLQSPQLVTHCTEAGVINQSSTRPSYLVLS